MKNILLLLITLIVFGTTFTSCKKEIVKPNKIEDSIIGSWDFDGDVNSADSDADGTFNFLFNSDGEGFKKATSITSDEKAIKWWINDDGTFQYQNWNYVTESWQSNATSPVVITMPDKNTLILGDIRYLKL